MAENVVRLPQQPASDPFSTLWEMGYERLCPIIPPGVPVSEKSNLFNRIAKGEDARGKSPGVKRSDGTWSGYDWRASDPDEYDLRRWAQMGAGVGIKTGKNIVLIDADTLHEDRAAVIKAEVEAMFGPLPTRIGQHPKAGYALGMDGDCPYLCVSFGELNDKGSLTERVEVLSEGKQFVAYGVHPKTKAPYRWVSKLLPVDQLPKATEAQIRELLARIAAKMPSATPIKAEGSKSEVDQESLRGELELVRKAVQATPNTSTLFPTRESYRDFGYAIKAALPDDPEEALDLFHDWCQRWAGGTNEREIVEADWRRMKPPFRRGASWLYETAEKCSDGKFRHLAEKFFEPVPEDVESIFAPDAADHAPRGLNTFTLASLAGLPVPAQKWLVKDFIPHGTVTMLGGDGAAGKSLLALQLAEAVSLGREWIGLETCVKGRVLFLSAEDERDELHRRSVRINPELEALTDVSVCVLAGDDATLALPSGRDGKVLKPTPLFERLLVTVSELRPSLVVLDTLADLFGGDENFKLHARQFVGLLVKMARDWNLTVLLLYHPSESGMASGSGKSGNTAWNNSIRSRIYLEASKEDRDVRHLETKKANRAARGEKLSVRWVSGRFLREGALTSASRSEIENEADRVFLKLLAQFEKEGRIVTHAHNANNSAAKVFSEHPASEGVGKVHFVKSIDRLLANGQISIETYGPPSRRQNRLVRTDCPPEDHLKPLEADLFDGCVQS